MTLPRQTGRPFSYKINKKRFQLLNTNKSNISTVLLNSENERTQNPCRKYREDDLTIARDVLNF